MSYKTLLLGLSCVLALSACDSDSPKSSSKSTTYSYNFGVGGCAPSVFKGRFSTFAEMCQALQYQAQLYPCAAPHILRHLEDKNCHRSDFLHMNPTTGGGLPQTLTQPGIFYNEYQERYILTPQGPVRLESPNLHDEQMQEAYAQSYVQTEVDRWICEHDVCRKPEQKLEIRNGKVYLDGVLAYDPSFDPSNVYGPNHPYSHHRQEEDDSVYGPNHHEYKGGTSAGNTGSTLIRPDQQKPAENRNSNAGTDSSPRRTETVATTPVTPTPVTRETPQSTNEEPKKEIPRPEPRPQTPANPDSTVAAQHEEPTAKTPEETKPITDKPAETDSTETRPEDTAPTPTAEVPPATETPTSEEEVSDVSNEVQPQDFNLIYFTATGAMYTEIPNPQNQQRFPILKVTAKIDSRSPLHNKKHSQPIKDLDVEILTAENTTACRPIAQISSNNDIMILTLKTKDQTDVSQLQSCKDWFQVIRKNSFEIQTPELQTDKGVISGKFNFVLSQ